VGSELFIRYSDQLPPFEETHFVRATDDHPDAPTAASDPTYEYTPAYYWYPSQANIGYPGIGLAPYTWPTGETRRNIPDDTIPLKEGANIMSSDDKHVGDVERILVDPDSNTVTHFVISQGLLFKDRKLVPVQWVKWVEEDNVYLVVNSKLLERLPSYEE
jgi:sporulation protein YlmC with PRC-barrel domain